MSNPVLSEQQWGDLAEREGHQTGSNVMTINGAVMKTGMLLVVLLVTMGWMFNKFWNNGEPVRELVMPWMIGGMIVGLGLALLTIFVKRLAMFTSLAYAVAQGLFIGGFTMFMEAQYPGIPLLAACFTVATLLGMLLLYVTGVIKASPGLIKGVMGATAGLMIGVALLWVLSIFGVGGGIMHMLYIDNGPIGIGFSILCIGLAAFNLVVDFHVIEEGAKNRLPKYMEWLAAFGLMVTLVWLYIEILRLLAKTRRE
jgi:uncharacterized YccA/Bax inhibitor family protein